MKLFRCQICGDPYLGEERPVNCPFCGAHARYLVLQEDYVEPVIESLSEVSKKNLETTLGLEVSNAEFYACASRRAQSDEMRNLFKALSKVESEHASLVSKALGIKKPPINLESEVCSGDDVANLKESHRVEERAIKLYGKFLSEASEPRVQEIFSALVGIESDHLSLSEERLK
jgi:rubrerythrin